MPTGWPFFAQTIAQVAWPAPLPASFFAVEQATSTTSPFTVMSAANSTAANAGMASAATNAAPATNEISLRMRNSFWEEAHSAAFYGALSRQSGAILQAQFTDEVF